MEADNNMALTVFFSPTVVFLLKGACDSFWCTVRQNFTPMALPPLPDRMTSRPSSLFLNDLCLGHNLTSVDCPCFYSFLSILNFSVCIFQYSKLILRERCTILWMRVKSEIPSTTAHGHKEFMRHQRAGNVYRPEQCLSPNTLK